MRFARLWALLVVGAALAAGPALAAAPEEEGASGEPSTADERTDAEADEAGESKKETEDSDSEKAAPPKRKRFSLFNRLRVKDTPAAETAPERRAKDSEPAPRKPAAAVAAAPAGAAAREPAPAPAPPPAAAPDAQPAPAPPRAPPPRLRPRAGVPASISRVVTQLAVTPLAADPEVSRHIEAVQGGDLGPERLNDLAVLLGRRGYTAAAISFQQEAVKRAPKNALLWLNLGTLHRDAGNMHLAERGYRRAASLDPLSALAYYNLGALREARGDYDGAIELYKKALRLDPSLADPRHNPQVVNTQLLLAVQLQLYQEKAGALGLPLVPAGATAPAAEKRRQEPGAPTREP